MKDRDFEKAAKKFLDKKSKQKSSKNTGWCLYGKNGCNDPVHELCMCNMQIN